MKLSPFSLGTLHFIGIGGIGMSALAEICQDLGISTQGSDIQHNANIARLEKKGIRIFVNQQPSNIHAANTIVISSAIKKDNPEYKKALELQLPIIHRADLLAQILRLKWSISIAGSHGKTTITSLVSHLLETAQMNPTVINGGIINSFQSNACLGSGDWIVTEADESDGTFTKLFPTIGVVSNLDEEHMDYYTSFENLKSAFITFLKNIPFFGCALLGYDDPDVRELIPNLKNLKILTYGKNSNANLYASNITQKPSGMYFDIYVQNTNHLPTTTIKNVHLSMLGDHNIQNALAAVGIGLQLGISKDTICKALSSFTGVKRRLTVILSSENKATVYDDYAHHPKEVMATLKALLPLKENHPKRRIIAIFQPHRYSRLQHLFNDFSQSFSLADETYILPVFAAGEKPISGINHQTLAKSASKHSPHPIIALDGPDDVYPSISKNLQPDDIVIFMGAGSITSFASDFVSSYQKTS